MSVDTSVGGGTSIRSDAFVGNVLGGAAFGSVHGLHHIHNATELAKCGTTAQPYRQNVSR